MVKRFLITTALEETWRDDQPALFLGEWCRRFSRRDRWSKMDAHVLPYHWDDRAKLHADYQYLNALYERLLPTLADQLNQIHDVDHGLRYWRILIGPWLGYFIQMLFDRWTSIKEAVQRYDISESIVLVGQDDALVPNDMAGFSSLFVNDEWNHLIYGELLRQHPHIVLLTQQQRTISIDAREVPAVSTKRRLQRAMAATYARLASMRTRNDDAFLLSTYLPYRDEMKLQQRLRQVAQLWRSIPAVKTSVDRARRNWLVTGEPRSEFEQCACSMIPRHIPTAYLEGYSRLVDQGARLPWPKTPKVIWTSNAENGDDVFKVWAAQKVENGAPLVIGQHGGHYGVGRWSFSEDHQIAISDSYFSWGWTEPDQPKVKAVGMLKAATRTATDHGKQPNALLVTTHVPRYSYWMYSVMVGRQCLDYFEDQFEFVAKLPPHIQQALVIRLYPEDRGWDQVARWQDRCPDIRLDEGRSSMNDLIRNSRVYISTYNATTYLESFAMNVPTVMYWNPRHWELRDSAAPYFAALQRVGIFHETPASAAQHLAAVWDDIDTWWNSSEVRDAVETFKQRYCYAPDDLIDRAQAALLNVARDNR